jgi:hypothetical protein
MIQSIIEEELTKNGWSCTFDKNKKNTIRFHNRKYYASNPYDEFIIEYISKDEVAVTVPIPFCESSISYTHVFNESNMNDIHDYIKMHLSNYNDVKKHF